MMNDTQATNVIELEGELDTKNLLNNNNNSNNNTSTSNNQSINFGNMLNSIPNFPNLSLQQIKPQEWITKRRETLKPWTEFFQFSKYKKPLGVGQSFSRLLKNIEYFQSNYMFVFVGLAIYCILTSPYLLFALLGFVGACYILHLKNKDGRLKIMGKELSLAQLYSAAGICSIPLFIIAGATSAVFWIIGASIVIICLHAIFYSREEEDPFMAQMTTV